MKYRYIVDYQLVNTTSGSIFYGRKEGNDIDALTNEIKNINEDGWVFKLIEKIYENKTSNICTKCNGTGFIPKFVQYKGGICYYCKGTGRR